MSEINAALLLSQLEFSATIQHRRRIAFDMYMSELSSWAENIGADSHTNFNMRTDHVIFSQF
jgi:dTDP-4-amino-4,6-dideoxygalactose transaminase